MQNFIKEKKTWCFIAALAGGHAFALENPEEAPRALLALGRLHPLILHLPIGALVFAFFLDVYGRVKNTYATQTVKLALAFSAISATIACVLGYFLSLEGGYSNDVLDVHFYAGIMTAVLAVLLYFFISSSNQKVKQFFFPLFMLAMISLTVAGHYGSILTHGDNFLTEYLQPKPEAKAITKIDDLQLYDDVVLKIFDEKCIQCHNPSKAKGDLSLSSTESILKGGESGEIITLGDASSSLLYKSLLLPISDKKHMPPEGKPQLSKKEISLIKYWLNNSDVNPKISSLQKNDTIVSFLKDYLVLSTKKIKPAEKSDIKEVESAGFLVRSLAPNDPRLWVKFPEDTITEDIMENLNELKEQIVELDLKNVLLNDNMTRVIKKLENLEKLELGNTLITDKTLEYLEKSKTLKILNLVNTDVTMKGIQKLLTHIAPKHIYLWQTNITQDAIDNLEKTYGIQLLSGIPDDFVEDIKMQKPSFLNEKSIFTDTLTISLDTKLKGTKFYYALNGEIADSTSTLYKEPLVIDTTTQISVRAYKKGWEASEPLQTTFYKTKYDVVGYEVAQKPEKQYSGIKKLFDKQLGSENFRDSKWLGFLGNDCNTTVDFGEEKKLSHITVSCLSKQGDWILFPKEIQVYASNSKNSGFKKIGSLKLKEDNKNELATLKSFHVEFPEYRAKYFKVIVKNGGPLPEWHPGAGNPAWVFVDEIMF